MSPSHCPICKRAVPARAENPTAPFCSERCRHPDLANWLDESYRVPTMVTERTIEEVELPRPDPSEHVQRH